MKRLVIYGSLFFACHPNSAVIKDPKPTPTTQETQAPAQSYVVVWSDAVFYQAPNQEGLTAQAVHAAPRGAAPVSAWVLQRKADAGEFVEVSLPTEERAYCGYALRSPLEDFDLKLYVKKSDVLPVLASPFTVRDADRSSVTLRPGTIAQPTGANTYRLFDGDLSMEVSLTAEQVSDQFTASAAQPQMAVDVEVRPEAERSFGTQKASFGYSLFGHRLATEGDKVLVSFGSACSEHQAWFAQDAVHEAARLMPNTEHNSQSSVAAGVKVYWPDGAVAGVTRKEVWLGEPAEVKASDNRACFNTSVYRGAVGGWLGGVAAQALPYAFPLCFEPSALK